MQHQQARRIKPKEVPTTSVSGTCSSCGSLVKKRTSTWLSSAAILSESCRQSAAVTQKSVVMCASCQLGICYITLKYCLLATFAIPLHGLNYRTGTSPLAQVLHSTLSNDTLLCALNIEKIVSQYRCFIVRVLATMQEAADAIKRAALTGTKRPSGDFVSTQATKPRLRRWQICIASCMAVSSSPPAPLIAVSATCLEPPS
jgi:hypothetical protein